ncbi:MAG TPA: hypothetical protein VEV37_03360 [Bryobacteraceae bacterium]|nr:hypothetical protein [Bryobacteraceae bacterium]
MLRYERKHIASCTSGAACRKCPYWIEGRHQGNRWQQSLRTTDAKTAAQLVERVILRGQLQLAAPESSPVTIADAMKEFMRVLELRSAALGTVANRKLLTGAPQREKFAKARKVAAMSPPLLPFAEHSGIKLLG